MGLNDTPSGERLHIGFFGRRNAGKSSLINAVTGQEVAVVSPEKGTTTDPVTKAMELLPLGPVLLIDTPGFDDTGNLGELRVQRTHRILNKTDIAVLVLDPADGMTAADEELLQIFHKRSIPHLIVCNKCDDGEIPAAMRQKDALCVSARKKLGIEELKERIAHLVPHEEPRKFVRDLLAPQARVLLITPMDKAAPKGRLILPQQQAIRDILEARAIALVCQETEIITALESLKNPPDLVICDSQIFQKAAAALPASIPLTSFSILMARYKGFLDDAVDGVAFIPHLSDGDIVLISEGCTHHRQCNDIGTVKIPHWLTEHTKKNLRFETSSGQTFPEDLQKHRLIIHCGGCMLNQREMRYRMKCARDQGIPITNYGTLIAYLHDILPRSLEIFPNLAAKVKKQDDSLKMQHI